MGKSKKSIFNIAVLVVSAAVMVFFLFRVDGPQKIFSTISSAKPIFLLCAAICMLFYWLLEAGAFHSICHGIKSKISFKECFHTSMIGQLFNCITPFATGGQPVQAYRLVQCGMGLGQASCALLAKFIIYQSVLTLYTVVVIVSKLAFFVSKVSGFTFIVFIGFAANTIVMALILSVGFFPRITKAVLIKALKLLAKLKLIKKPEEKEAKLCGEIDKFYSDFEKLKKNPKAFLLPCFFTALQLTAFFSVPYFVCLALSANMVSYVLVVCAAAFVLLISSFVPLPGGSGGAEGGFYMFFGMFFLQSGVLAAAVLLWRIMTFYLPIAAGMVFSHIKPSKNPNAMIAKQIEDAA